MKRMKKETKAWIFHAVLVALLLALLVATAALQEEKIVIPEEEIAEELLPESEAE
ncbi:MAG: hypothetical protein J5849_01805 [Clostridia bacterium]|nr:hypothetical protein [Clostridia bacterium]